VLKDLLAVLVLKEHREHKVLKVHKVLKEVKVLKEQFKV
jgi:hypothetical protein